MVRNCIQTDISNNTNTHTHARIRISLTLISILNTEWKLDSEWLVCCVAVKNSVVETKKKKCNFIGAQLMLRSALMVGHSSSSQQQQQKREKTDWTHLIDCIASMNAVKCWQSRCGAIETIRFHLKAYNYTVRLVCVVLFDHSPAHKTWSATTATNSNELTHVIIIQIVPTFSAISFMRAWSMASN